MFPAAAGEPPTLPSPFDLLDPHASYFAERRASKRRIARCRIEAPAGATPVAERSLVSDEHRQARRVSRSLLLFAEAVA